MISETFADGDSIIHRIDPQYRILSAALYSGVIAVAKDILTLSIAVFISIVILGVARLNYQQVAKRLLVISGFVFLFICLFILVFDFIFVF